MRKSYISTILLSTLLLSGCSDNKQDKKDNQPAQKVTQASSIVVEKNKDRYEQKVEDKAHDDSNRSYYGNYDEQGTRESQRPRTALDANLNIRSPYERIRISMMAKKLSKNFILKCSACHDDYANGIIGPSLLGKTPDFIEEKIKKFRSDKTANVLMSDLVSKMDDSEISALATEIYNFNESIKNLGDNNAN